MPSIPFPSGLTITNPLVQYRTLLRLHRLDNDPAQHRLALKLQDLYHQLKDYNPHLDYSDRLNQISRAIGSSADRNDADKGFSRSGPTRPSLSSLFRRSTDGSSTALIRSITSRESALKIQSPKGLLIHGEVGRGKTLLLNLLADALPTDKKRRLHFNVFMLEIFRKLEENRKERLASALLSPDMAYEHSILSLAREFIFTSPIIFLDEFQLPDRAASKLLSSLLTSFFHLGGVLIATSNRLPEELAKAAGVEFALPGRSQSLGAVKSARNLAPGAADFADFLDVLKARCDVWEMEGEMDWRRQESNSRPPGPSVYPEERSEVLHDSFSMDLDSMPSTGPIPVSSPVWSEDPESESVAATIPSWYQLSSSRSPAAAVDQDWEQNVALKTSSGQRIRLAEIPWGSSSLHVYGRTLYVPKQHSGMTMWSFSDLCGTNLGPADYITLASTFDTLILVDVPILTFLMKNEARRFITLLDALYESGCRLLIRAAAPPDDLFFPETRADTSVLLAREAENDDPVYQETYSEVYQDSTFPFRPNVSSYLEDDEPVPRSAFRHIKEPSFRSVLADEDADFGPVYGNGRGSGLARDERHHATSVHTADGPDFSQAHSALVGEDERFAYKRARSRLWEMCGDRWWSREDFWRPVDAKIRHWERGRGGDEGRLIIERAGGDSAEMFKYGASPFRTIQGPPPQFNFTHFWRMMTWGKKAGAWGKGELKGREVADSSKKEQDP